jgi:hypothetical protein
MVKKSSKSTSGNRCGAVTTDAPPCISRRSLGTRGGPSPQLIAEPSLTNGIAPGFTPFNPAYLSMVRTE